MQEKYVRLNNWGGGGGTECEQFRYQYYGWRTEGAWVVPSARCQLMHYGQSTRCLATGGN